jgi:hypothetical protein
MNCAGSGDSSGKNLAALADELAELCAVLIIDKCNLVCTENANLFSSVVVSGTSRTNNRSFGLVFHLIKSSYSNSMP